VAEKDVTTGTGAQDGGDAQATGTPGTTDRNAIAIPPEVQQELDTLRAQKAQALAEKETLERTKAELDAMRRGAVQPTTDPEQQAMMQRANFIRQQAAAGDEIAQAILDLAGGIQRTEQRTIERIELDKVTDETKRQAVRDLYERGGFTDMGAARRHYELTERAASLERETEALKRQVAQTTTAAAAEAEPGMAVRSVGASEHKRRMAMEEYGAKLRDPNIPIADKLALKCRVSTGETQLTE
jgi:hypothetical protein